MNLFKSKSDKSKTETVVENLEINIGRTKVRFTFKNNEEADVTIIGNYSLDTFSRYKKPLVTVNHSRDVLHDFLDSIDTGHVKFIVSDNNDYYLLKYTEIAKVKVIEETNHKVYEKVSYLREVKESSDGHSK